MKKQMSAKRQETLHRLLHTLREQEVKEIEKQIGRELDAGLTQKIDAAMDVGDWASLDLAEGIDYKILEMRYHTYKEIADAFRRFESGTYGACENCGVEIPLNRLKAEPFARYCVSCSSKFEALDRVEKELGKSATL